MIQKKYTRWITFSTLLLGMAIFGCSANQGDGFAKYTESNGSLSRETSSSPVYLDNSQDEQVSYIKKGENKPVRVTPTRARELAASVNEEKLSPIESEFKAAVTLEALDSFIGKYSPDELAFVAVQRIAQPLIDVKDWTGANNVFVKYRDKFSAKSAAFDTISAILLAPVEGVTVHNLGPGVNTAEGEYSPVISSDGKKLLFARDCGVCGGGEEVLISNFNDAGVAGGAEKFGPPLSSRGNEIPLAISADGNTLAVYGNYSGTLGRGDIYHLDKTADSWSPLQHYPAPLNSEFFDSNAMYSADGHAILFVSERPGGVGEFHKKGSFFHGDYDGNTDIYAYVVDANGVGQVINLGSTINTPYAEYSPFLHSDGKTLYFSSNGHPGIGGLDVFKSTRLSPNSWTEWSVPVNLGKEINTTYNDWGYQFAVTGDKAYFAAGNRPEGYGSSDIYSVSLPGMARSSGVITVSGVVSDPAGNVLSADIRWNDMKLAKEVGHATSDPQTGKYLIHLPVGGSYTYYAEKTGYMGESQALDLSDELGYREFVMDIVLYPLSGQTQRSDMVAALRMNNIFFDFDKVKLRSESKLELDRWTKMLQENPSVKLEVDGHTDSIGTDSYNHSLSLRRAQAVVAYLVGHGIDATRLQAKGFGEEIPVASNKTGYGRQHNRRVEVKIFNNGNL